MFLSFDILNTECIPKINNIVFKKKQNNKIIKNSYFIQLNYIHSLFTLSSLIYTLPYLNHVCEKDNRIQKIKHTFYISLEVQRLLIEIEKNILDKYNIVHPTKIVHYRLQNRLITNSNTVICNSSTTSYQYGYPLLCIKFIGVCETDSVVSIIYKFNVY